MNLLDHSEIIQRLHRAKIPLAIFLCALLLLLSTGKRQETHGLESSDDLSIEPVSLAEEEKRLADILQTIDGVGKTHVLLSCRASAQTEYVADGEKTVVLSVGSGKQAALEKRIQYPEYLGAIIVCEGGDNPNVRWSVLEAVSRFTGLRSDQITVLKMEA